MSILNFLIVLIFIFTSIPPVSADPLNTVEFSFPAGVTLSDNGLFDVKESLGDNDCTESGTPIQVTITSTAPGGAVRDSITLDAIEINNPAARIPTSGTCVFGNTFLHFMPDNQRFSVGERAVVTQHETSGGQDTNGVIDTIDITVKSTSTPAGITLTLTETNPNTGIFKNKLLFTDGPSVPNEALHVSPGDIITADYLARLSYGQILPSPSGSAGVLLADVGDTITATYNGFSGTTSICVCGGPGGGGGGLIRPGLVLDVILGHGSGRDISPPSLYISKSDLQKLNLPQEVLLGMLQPDPFKPLLPINDSSIDLPFSIGDQGFLITQFASTISTRTLEVDKATKLKLVFFEESEIEHLALYTNLRGINKGIENSDTSITFQKGKNLEITDPQGFFNSVQFNQTVNRPKNEFILNFIFAKPMEKSDIIIRVWDMDRNSLDVKIFDAWRIISINATDIQKGNEIKLNSTIISNTTFDESLQEQFQNSTSESKSLQSSEPLSPAELLGTMGIDVNHIPSWYLKTYLWMTNGDITEQEFIDGIWYLYRVGVI